MASVSILHVSDPQNHVKATPMPSDPVQVGWRLLLGTDPARPGETYELAMPVPASVAATGDKATKKATLTTLLEGLGFGSVEVVYLEPSDRWPLSMPILGYVKPSKVGTSFVLAALHPIVPMVTARATWRNDAMPLSQTGLDTRTMALEWSPSTMQPWSTWSTGRYRAARLPNGLWWARSDSGEDVLGYSPAEVFAKLGTSV